LKRIPFILAVTIAWQSVTPAEAVTYTPIAHLSLLGGQYFTGDTHSNGGNFDGSFVPVLGLSSRFYLIPILMTSYHQTQSVYNFLGQNTLIEEQLDQTGVLRAAWAINSNWRLKPRIGAKKEWIQESSDETLSDGLFNYHRLFGGASLERALGNGSLEMGYEYGATRYPNYQALDSDPRLTSTGITQNAGTDVLNFNSHELSLLYQLSASNNRWNAGSNFTWIRENFRDQKVIGVDSQGFQSFEDTQRVDDIFNLALSQTLRTSHRWGYSVGETFQEYLSNQNSFDANQLFGTPFTGGYYNFFDMQFTPTVTLFTLEERLQYSLGGTLGYRKYAHRKAQDGFGTNLDDQIHSWDRGLNLVIRYMPYRASSNHWLRGLGLMLTGSVLTYKSNTRYEANYPYNYTVMNYLGGLTWDF
jgi:hypothetical protein